MNWRDFDRQRQSEIAAARARAIAVGLLQGNSRAAITDVSLRADNAEEAFIAARLAFLELSEKRKDIRAECLAAAKACEKAADWGSVYCDEALEIAIEILDAAAPAPRPGPHADYQRVNDLSKHVPTVPAYRELPSRGTIASRAAIAARTRRVNDALARERARALGAPAAVGEAT
jgi:hypothetical protein